MDPCVAGDNVGEAGLELVEHLLHLVQHRTHPVDVGAGGVHEEHKLASYLGTTGAADHASPVEGACAERTVPAFLGASLKPVGKVLVPRDTVRGALQVARCERPCPAGGESLGLVHPLFVRSLLCSLTVRGVELLKGLAVLKLRLAEVIVTTTELSGGCPTPRAIRGWGLTMLVRLGTTLAGLTFMLTIRIVLVTGVTTVLITSLVAGVRVRGAGAIASLVTFLVGLLGATAVHVHRRNGVGLEDLLDELLGGQVFLVGIV